MALVGQLVHQRAESSPRACCFFHHQSVEFVDISSFASLGPNVRLHQSQSFRHANPDTFSPLGFAFTFCRFFCHHICQGIGKHVVEADLVLRDDLWADVFQVRLDFDKVRDTTALIDQLEKD